MLHFGNLIFKDHKILSIFLCAKINVGPNLCDLPMHENSEI